MVSLMLTLALVGALLLTGSPSPKLSAAEQTYVAARDAETVRFSKGEGPFDAEREALERMRGMLRDIIGPVRLPGLAGQGELAYEGFWGVGSTPGVVDGLWFDWQGTHMFVTTRALYMLAAGGSRGQTATDTEDDLVARTVHAGHAAFVTFADLPVKFSAEAKRGRAVLGLSAQDDGPFPPSDLVVQMERGGKMFVVAAALQPPMEQVEDCAMKYLAATKSSGGGADDRVKTRERAFASYRRCFGQAVASLPTYGGVLTRAQTIVDLLESANPAGSPAPR